MATDGESELAAKAVLEPLRRHARDPSYDFWIGPGWYELALRCHEAVVAEFPEYELLAVKQKWAALAFQAFPHRWTPNSTAWDRSEIARLSQLTEEFISLSRIICENCGRPGALRTTRHIHLTLCDDCETSVGPRGVG